MIGKCMSDMKKVMSHHFGERGVPWSSIAKFILRFVAIALFISALCYLYVEHVHCNCSERKGKDVRDRHDHHIVAKAGRRPGRSGGQKQQKSEQIFWKAPRVPPDLMDAGQDNGQLIKHIRDHWIVKPLQGPSILSNPDRVDRSQAGQALCVDHLLDEKENGFFIEAGASNGEIFSNTLYLERFRNWTGLLVEPSPDYFTQLLNKRRNAYMINACLSPTTYPMVLNLSVAKMMSSLEDFAEESQLHAIRKPKRYSRTVEVMCFPAYSILKALEISHVDYFSLDVGGPELDVLESMPLSKLDIEIFGVEYRIPKDHVLSQNKMESIVNHMANYGYHFAGKLLRLDVILKKGQKMKQDGVCFPQRRGE